MLICTCYGEFIGFCSQVYSNSVPSYLLALVRLKYHYLVFPLDCNNPKRKWSRSESSAELWCSAPGEKAYRTEQDQCTAHTWWLLRNISRLMSMSQFNRINARHLLCCFDGRLGQCIMLFSSCSHTSFSNCIICHGKCKQSVIDNHQGNNLSHVG